MRPIEVAIRCSAFLRGNILGIIILAIITGVAGNFVFDWVKPSEKKETTIRVELSASSPQAGVPEFTRPSRIDQGVHQPYERPSSPGSAPKR